MPMWCQIIETEVVTKGLFIIPIRWASLCDVLARLYPSEVFCSRLLRPCGYVQLNRARLNADAGVENEKRKKIHSIISHNLPFPVHGTTCAPSRTSRARRAHRDECHWRQIRCVFQYFQFSQCSFAPAHNGFAQKYLLDSGGNFFPLLSVFRKLNGIFPPRLPTELTAISYINLSKGANQEADERNMLMRIYGIESGFMGRRVLSRWNFTLNESQSFRTRQAQSIN